MLNMDQKLAHLCPNREKVQGHICPEGHVSCTAVPCVEEDGRGHG